MRWRTLTRDVKNADTYFLYDVHDSGREKLCTLRKLPALLRLGYQQTTYPKQWRKLDQWATDQYEFESPPYILLDDIPFEPTTALAAISTQYYEDNYQLYSLSRVLDRYVNVPARLAVGGDSKTFEPAKAKRSLDESPFVDTVHDYRQVYNAFDQRSADTIYEYPLTDTKNIFIQENAALYTLVSGDTITTLEAFFEILPDAPYLPIWNTFTAIFTQTRAKGATVLNTTQREGLAKWLRRRMELDYTTGEAVASQLNNLARRRERLFNPYYRREMTQEKQVTQILRRLPESSDNAYRCRLKTWLQEATNEC